MRNIIILLFLSLSILLSSCSGCSESGRRADERRNKLRAIDLITREVIPTYYVVSRIDKAIDYKIDNYVRYLAEASFNPKFSSLNYDHVVFIDKPNKFNVGDTIHLVKRE